MQLKIRNHLLKNTSVSISLDEKSLKIHFLASHLKFSQQTWAFLLISMGNAFIKKYHRELIPGQIKLQYVGWLLLDIGEVAPEGEIQACIIGGYFWEESNMQFLLW
jgi:hypothetical protein